MTNFMRHMINGKRQFIRIWPDMTEEFIVRTEPNGEHIVTRTLITNDDSIVSSNVYVFPHPVPPPPGAEVICSQFNLTVDESTCCVCLEDYSENLPMVCKMNCNHTVCMSCTKHILMQNRLCPLCRTLIASIHIQKDTSSTLI